MRGKEANYCVDRFNFCLLKMRPLLLGLCYNGGKKSVVVIDSQKQQMSSGLLIIQKKTFLWSFFMIWTVVKDSLVQHILMLAASRSYSWNVIISFHYCASMLATAVSRGIMFSSCQTVRPILVNMISEKHLEGSCLNLAQTSTWPFLIEENEI